MTDEDFTKVKHEVFVGNLSGHRTNWLITLMNLRGLKNQDVIFSVIATEKMREEFHDKWGFDTRLRFFQSVNSWLSFQKESAHPTIMKNVLVLEGDKFLRLRAKNISYFFLIMRPFLHSYRFRDLSVFFWKKILIFVRLRVNRDSVRQLSLPYYKGWFFQSSWIQDDLTIIKLNEADSKFRPIEVQPSAERDYFLLTGYLNDRKGIDKALAFTVQFNHSIDPIEVDLRVRGSLDSDDYGSGTGEFLDIKFGYLEDNDYYSQIAGALAVLLFYTNIGASGILLEALYFKKPIITSNWRLYRKLSNLPKHLIYFAQDLLDGNRSFEKPEANLALNLEIDQSSLSNWIMSVVSPKKS